MGSKYGMAVQTEAFQRDLHIKFGMAIDQCVGAIVGNKDSVEVKENFYLQVYYLFKNITLQTRQYLKLYMFLFIYNSALEKVS